MERKTHREGWKGEESVKDRITLPKAKIVEFLDGTYTLDMALREGKVKNQSFYLSMSQSINQPTITQSSHPSIHPSMSMQLVSHSLSLSSCQTVSLLINPSINSIVMSFLGNHGGV